MLLVEVGVVHIPLEGSSVFYVLVGGSFVWYDIPTPARSLYSARHLSFGGGNYPGEAILTSPHSSPYPMFRSWLFRSRFHPFRFDF